MKSSKDSLRQLYAGQCLGSHGMEHTSHSRWSGAPASLTLLHAELTGVLPEGQDHLRFFRPPYG